MAVITSMPAQSIIQGWKGVVDFYEYRGLACARKWPIWRPRQPYPAELANQLKFRTANKAIATSPPLIRAAWVRMAQGTPFRWQDLAVRAYYRGLNG
ncbi:MAG: hypothetical protein A2V75_09090 [Actinobacteria bacterium RBG_16_70_17]|nr:MAG: hypothetical protein A2V75_09090 [Actinobacteria bacterium RBG_16_70_17]